MSKTRLVAATLVVGGLVAASEAQAQLGQQCGGTFPAACAELLAVEYSGDVLTLIVSNTTTGHSDAFIGSLYLVFASAVPGLADDRAWVEYGAWDGAAFTAGGDSEAWRLSDPSGQPGGFGIDFDVSVSDNAPNGGPAGRRGDNSLRIRSGDVARITIVFADDLAEAPIDRTAHMQGLTGGESDWTEPLATPEPVTVLLLGSGLAALGGVSALRRRRKGGG